MRVTVSNRALRVARPGGHNTQPLPSGLSRQDNHKSSSYRHPLSGRMAVAVQEGSRLRLGKRLNCYIYSVVVGVMREKYSGTVAITNHDRFGVCNLLCHLFRGHCSKLSGHRSGSGHEPTVAGWSAGKPTFLAKNGHTTGSGGEVASPIPNRPQDRKHRVHACQSFQDPY